MMTLENAQFDILSKIRASLELDKIFQTTIDELRRLLGVDRVGVLRLSPASGWDEGSFVAESVASGFDAALAQQVVDHCFGKEHATAYRDGRIQAINDIDKANLSDCHLDILKRFQVKANLLVPLLNDQSLWGLLCIHQCSGPRDWQTNEIEFVSKLAAQLGVAIEHAELVDEKQRQADELNRILAELKALQAQMIHTGKMAGLAQITAGVAHEINNPINFVHGNLDHVAANVNDLLKVLELYQVHHPDCHPAVQSAITSLDVDFLRRDLSKVLASMKTGTRRIAKIVSSLKQFSHLDEAACKRADLSEEIDTVLLLLESRFQPTRHRSTILLEKKYCPAPLLMCYPAQISQVIMAIIANALDALDDVSWPKATSADGLTVEQPQISVKISRQEGDLTVAIHNNGSTISPENQARLFEPFFTTKPAGKGVGIGLAICDRIITQHLGSLQCTSNASDGTTFLIRLPEKME